MSTGNTSNEGGLTWEHVQEQIFNKLVQTIEGSLTNGVGPFFTYLIGNNGTGKSRQLARIASHYEKAESNSPEVIGCISNAVYDRFTLTSRGRIEYLGVRTSGNAVFHRAIDRQIVRMILKGMLRKKKVISLLEESLQMSFSFSIGSSEGAVKQKDLTHYVDQRKLKKGFTLTDYLNLEQRRTLAELIGVDLNFSKLTIKQADAILAFIELNPVVNVEVIKKEIPGKISFSDLSTGEQNRALIYAKVASVAKQNSLILIDEPEISLHLHWQMGFHRDIKKILSDLKRFHVVIATHAPLIISEGAKHDHSTNGTVVVLETRLDPDKRPALDVKVHTFKEILSHERLVLDFFDTATYKTPAVDFEITETLLRAVRESSQQKKSSLVAQLEELKAKAGITKADIQHIESAMRIVQHQTLTHSEEAHSDDDIV